MIPIMDLWLPILLAAVLVFVVSSITHMVLTYHRSNYKELPGEEKVLEAMRNAGVGPGTYAFPCPGSPKEMGSPEMQEKYKRGPVGFLSVLPSGPPAMGKNLIQWFIYSIAIGVVTAYVTGRVLAPGVEYLRVFQIAGTVSFLGYAGSQVQESIWKGEKWSTSIKFLFDGFLYSLVTAGAFGWLWPSA